MSEDHVRRVMIADAMPPEPPAGIEAQVDRAYKAWLKRRGFVDHNNSIGARRIANIAKRKAGK